MFPAVFLIGLINTRVNGKLFLIGLNFAGDAAGWYDAGYSVWDAVPGRDELRAQRSGR